MDRSAVSSLRRPRRVSERTVRDPSGSVVTLSLAAGIAVRGRESARIEACLRSLAEQTASFKAILLVERTAGATSLKRVCEKYGAGYLAIPDNGGPFAKAHTSNVAIRKLKGSASHFVQIDADVIASPKLADTLLHRLAKGPSNLVSVFPRHLPRLPKPYLKYSFDELVSHGQRREGDRHAVGMCLVHSFDAFFQLRGYNEEFLGWGSEDTDYVQRAAGAGYKASMEELGPLVLHQWHPTPDRSRSWTNAQIARAGRSNGDDWGTV